MEAREEILFDGLIIGTFYIIEAAIIDVDHKGNAAFEGVVTAIGYFGTQKCITPSKYFL